MKQLKSENISLDIIVTSPPYNFNKNYGAYNDKRKKDEYLEWLNSVAKISLSVLKDDGSFFLNISGKPSDPNLPFEVIKEFQNVGYALQNIIHWIKSISIEKEDIGKNNHIKENISFGHFKPIASNRFVNDFHEYIFHFSRKGDVKLDKISSGVEYQDKTNISRWKSVKQDKRDRGNVWFIPYDTIQERRPHPAVFPVKLPYLCIKLHGIKNDTIVYDPFMGIGSTAVACLNLGVHYLGTEINDKYIKIALERLNRSKSIQN